MIACLDVAYLDSHAVAAGVWLADWSDEIPASAATAIVSPVAEYEPGEFYRRELPCLLEVLALGPPARVVVVDGYATLGHGRPGLGARLFDAFESRVAVVGVAKTRYTSATEAVPVLRGTSRSPLFVTAVGMDVTAAAERIASMHGPYRLPTVLKLVDALARTGAEEFTRKTPLPRS